MRIVSGIIVAQKPRASFVYVDPCELVDWCVRVTVHFNIGNNFLIKWIR